MIRLRLILLGVFFFGVFGTILFRAFQLQLLPHKKVARLAKRQLKQTLEIAGRRGTLTDRNGRELAISVNSVSIFANPKLIQRPANVARVLGQILDMPEKSILSKIQDGAEKKFVWIQRQLTATQMKDLEKVDLKSLPGIGVLPEYRREYPQGSLAAHSLGFVSVDGNGLEGVERKFNSLLKGERNFLTVQRDALGRPLFSQSDQIRLDSNHGARVELTLDSNLQNAAERALEQAIEAHQAEAGTVIVMEPHTGDLLALANYPTFDPNHASDFPAGVRRNRALTDPIEPGSTVKPFVVARAFEEKIVKPETMISAGNGFIKIGRKTIGEADAKHRFHKVSIVDLIRHSSNVGTVVLQQKLGYPKVEESFRRLGFGSVQGIEIGGESRGLFPRLKANQILEQATVSFGQGIAVTPLQMAVAYSALANGGFRVRPRIIKKIIPHETPKVRRESLEQISQLLGPEQPPVRVFSESAVDQIKSILEKVVQGEGTGELAKVSGFRVAGKTGTSQRVDFVRGGYQAGSYWSSFAGFLPADRPRYVIYVMIDRPSRGGYYGSMVAAPVFSKVAQSAIRFGSPGLIAQSKSVKPSVSVRGASGLLDTTNSARIESNVVSSQNFKAHGVPNLTGMPLAQAFRVLKKGGYRMELIGSGDRVNEQMPLPGQSNPPENVIYLKLR